MKISDMLNTFPRRCFTFLFGAVVIAVAVANDEEKFFLTNWPLFLCLDARFCVKKKKFNVINKHYLFSACVLLSSSFVCKLMTGLEKKTATKN